MSKKCTSCQKKFFVLNANRIKCDECEQGFCPNCIRKGTGIKLYCYICFMLNTRPVDRSIIMNIRTKDVKLYLERRNVRTDCCLEKDDLVNRFVWYVSKEPVINGRNKKRNRLNDFLSVISGSMPNLSEQNFTRRDTPPSQEQTSRNNFEQPSSSQRVPPRPPPARPPPPNNETSPEENASASPSFNNSSQRSSSTSTENSNTNDGAAQNIRKLIQITDIKNVQEIQDLSVKQLKELLFINRIDFKGCVEKDELIRKAVNLWIENQTEEEIERMPGEDLCKICMDAPLNCVLLECGHIATCINCGKQLSECPICRQYIVRVVHTFKA